MTRQDRAVKAAELRAQGLTGMQIAKRLGIRRSYAYALLTDPDGSRDRARKRSYNGTCIDCGASTDGSNGRANAPKRCQQCFNEVRHREACAAAIEKFQAFAAEHGRAPTAEEWRTGAPVDSSTVQRLFGSWTAGLEAAGLEPKRRYAGDRLEVRERAVELYVEGVSSREVAERLGCAAESVCRWVRAAGLPVRPAGRPKATA